MLRLLRDATAMYTKQLEIFVSFSATFPIAVVRKWEDILERWYADPTSKPDPFEEPVSRELS